MIGKVLQCAQRRCSDKVDVINQRRAKHVEKDEVSLEMQTGRHSLGWELA